MRWRSWRLCVEFLRLLLFLGIVRAFQLYLPAFFCIYRFLVLIRAIVFNDDDVWLWDRGRSGIDRSDRMLSLSISMGINCLTIALVLGWWS